ncbi:Cobalt/magnesium transport protein CorA [Hypsizygus marmoreus]|uniref:Cobalt/magnesium transport protein CorA n=1 Tax=Hypsizygus marmoreus TaxID=39966 RepID=A0A369K339_HYPMA|nr:Cobalt/magnesium transport protein CorA [Hypsizygus marmoreus]
MPRVLVAGSTYGGHHYSHGSVPPVGNGNESGNGNRLPRMPRTTFAGAEPGISPTSVSYGHIQEKCVIEVADYSMDNFTLRRFSNVEFVQLMAEPMPVHDLPRTSSLDSKRSCVRWINIGGLDWDVISAVGLKYNLHALALEDILHEQGHNQSKADYYSEHLFVRILCHSLEQHDNEDNDPNAVRPSVPSFKSEFPGHLESDLERAQFSAKDIDERSKTPITMNEHSSEFKSHFTALSGFLAPARQRRMIKIKSLTKGDRVNIRHQPLFIFLLRNGTVITMFPSPSLEFTAPIAERLQHPESVLRTSEDASLLVESFLDLVVDRVLEIMDEYQDKIHRLEHNVLLQPSMSTMRSLHILSGDLIMHKRTLEPIKTMIFGLRRYDLYRCAALADNAEAERERLGISEDNNGHEKKKKKKRKVEGYLSYKTVMYLADVYDHIEFVLTSLDMFAGISENLINYAFNTASYEMNQVMRRLTLATIIFLPLTLLTGYFGMNFVHFAAINNSDLLFWKISIPVMLALIPIFMLTDIQHIIQSLRKRWEARRSVKAYRRKP